jgi:hypothetical protein
MEMRIRDDGRPYAHDAWHASKTIQEQFEYAEFMHASEDVKRRAIEEAFGKIAESRPDASGRALKLPTQAATKTQTPPVARPAPSAADVKAATDYLEQRKREIGIATDPTMGLNASSPIPVGDLEQDIVARWKNEPTIRAEFRTLETYAGFRKGIADGTIKGFDANGEKLDHCDPVQQALKQAAEEDRAAGVDPRLPVSVRARQVWGLNPKVRAEFGDVEERYVAARIHAERSRRA